MAVIVDLDGEPPEAHPPDAAGYLSVKPLHHSLASIAADRQDDADSLDDARPNPNVNGFSAALSCYPIVKQLASQLDLNTLHSLSRTCRQFRVNLLQYRDQLVKQSLHCSIEDMNMGEKLAWHRKESRNYSMNGRQLTTGKVGECARDMVAECQRCGLVVCRNCTIKPPATPALRARHRRLCRTCTKAPLYLLTCPRHELSPSTDSSPPSSPSLPWTSREDNHEQAFTAAAFERTPCCCDSLIWLCQPCGVNMKNKDTMYVRAWSWRTRYSHYLGGVGTGAGEGNEGVECGRGASCLAARIVEHEIEANADTLASLEATTSERWKGTSYYAQEIEGIGGTFKMKAKRQIRVGECVKIHEDERDRSIQYLGREVAGKLRSWCSWCERVVLGEKDLAIALGQRPPSSSSSSASSSQ